MAQPMNRNARSDGGGAYELARAGANEGAPARRLPTSRRRRRGCLRRSLQARWEKLPPLAQAARRS